jgi:uncharacterized membrane-anchored protein
MEDMPRRDLPTRARTRTESPTGEPPPGAQSARARIQPALAKVPEITVLFWVLKLLSTGMGEAMSDFLGQQSVPLAAVIGMGGLFLALRLQLNRPEYSAPYYWFAVMMVAVFGTMAADGIHDGAGIGYEVTTPMFALITGMIFWVWYRREGTLSIHSINTRRRERFYWAAVLATFALGTAAGDLTAMSLNLGYWVSVLLFALIITIPAVMWWRGAMHPILAFWFAYVVTRPLGASFADGFSKPTLGGLDLGDGLVSAIALVVFVALVAHVARSRRDVQPAAEQVPPGVTEEREALAFGLTPAADFDT